MRQWGLSHPGESHSTTGMNFSYYNSCVKKTGNDDFWSFYFANADDKSTSSASSTPDAPHISTFVEADVALLDENINLDMTPEPLTGSVLAGRLAAEGFRGVTCILTGASLDEMDSLRQKPGVDLVFAKGSPLSAIAESIRRLHRTKRVLSHAAGAVQSNSAHDPCHSLDQKLCQGTCALP